MSNVSAREKTIRIHEVTVPNPATRRDICDLLRVADRKYRQVHGHADDWSEFYDDAYTIEARDDETVAIIMIDPS
jgi:hypothetical protein